MKKNTILWLCALVLTISGLSSCSSDDEATTSRPEAILNSLIIRSDKGEISWGKFYKSGEMYNPPHYYSGSGITSQGETFYYMGFGANIKDSKVFDILDIKFKSNRRMSLNDLKEGDTFDNSQFHAPAYDTPTWMEDIMRGEWGFDGYTLTDMAGSNGKFFMVYDDGFMNGTDCFLDKGEYKDSMTDAMRKSPTFNLKQRECMKRLLYTVANYSGALNGYSNATRLVPQVVPWRVGIDALMYVTGISFGLMALIFVAYQITKRLPE